MLSDICGQMVEQNATQTFSLYDTNFPSLTCSLDQSEIVLISGASPTCLKKTSELRLAVETVKVTHVIAAVA